MDKVIDWLKSLWMDFSLWWDQSCVVVTRDDYTPLLDVSGFLGILAFSVAVFTLTGPKFQIRQATAIIPFRPLFFVVLLVSAIITFAIEAVILYEVRIPNFIHPNTINYLITTAIAALILYWMKICFIRPPRFSRFTAKHFFDQAYFHISNGSKEEMLALAREIMREAPRLIHHSPRFKRHYLQDEKPIKMSALQTHAYYLNSLLSDTRFCGAVAKEIPFFPARMVEVAVDLKRYGWDFTGVDIDPVSIKSAQQICERNGLNIRLKRQNNAVDIFEGVVGSDDIFHVTLCNPPFHASLAQAQEGTLRKWRNLGKGHSAELNFGGQNAELWCPGGEIGFIARMIEQSMNFAEQCLWFTCLVSKKDSLKPLSRLLKKAKVVEFKVVEMAQGQKTSRFIAWTYYSERQRSL